MAETESSREIRRQIEQIASAMGRVAEQHTDAQIPQPRDVNPEFAGVREALSALLQRHRSAIQELEAANRQLKVEIAERAVVEVTLRESAERYRSVAQTALEAIITLDQRGRVLFWNQGAILMFGYGCGEIAGSPISRIMIGDTEENVLGLLEGFVGDVSSDAIGQTRELTGVRKDGTVLPVEISVSGWFSRERLFYTVIARDITERVRAVRELEKEKELLEVTLRSISEGVISTDANGSIMHINRAAEQLAGWNGEEATGMPVGKVLRLRQIRGEGRVEPLVEKVKRLRKVTGTSRSVLVTKDGSECRIESSAAPIYGPGELMIGVVVVFRDITKQQRVEEELLRARKLESVGVLAGGIAHDFNNILTGITVNLSMVKMQDDVGEHTASLVDEACRAVYRASKLTKQLLTFSKGGAPVRENASIRELIEESVHFCLSSSNVKCRLRIADDLHQVNIDKGQIDQVLNNLIINAVQAMPGGGTVTVSAENSQAGEGVSHDGASWLPLKPGEYIKVSVRDTGVGIPKKILEKVFDPYFTTKEQGNGLGLSTAYTILKKHDGHITVRSRPGRGTTFAFYLPASGREMAGRQVLRESLRPGRGRILVMDDDPAVRMVMEKLLTGAEYEVLTTQDGAQAISEYKEAIEAGRQFDLVIMDLTVPGGVGGKDAIRDILAIDPKAKVIVASGYSNDPVMSRYRDYGFAAVVHKPFDIEKFTKVVAELMKVG